MSRAKIQEWNDWDRLLAPISEESPCGQSLRYEGTYDEVREARREDDPKLPQGVWQTELKYADWQHVEAICTAALESKSKDLQIAAWLLEAWIQLDDFAGAARGLELIRRLCVEDWERLYPELQQDPGPRQAVFQWIDEKLSRRLRMTALTHPEIEGIPAYTLADWDVAMRNPEAAGRESVITVSKFEQSANLTPYDWFQQLDCDLRKTLETAQALEAVLDEKMGLQSPGLARFRAELKAASELTETMLAAARANLPAPTQASLAASGGQPQPLTEWERAMEQSDIGGDQVAGLRLATRSDAYRLLEEIAKFLHQNEPHSPTPYLLRRAIAWGNMRFDELLPELVKDRGELSEIMKLLHLDQAPDRPA